MYSKVSQYLSHLVGDPSSSAIDFHALSQWKWYFTDLHDHFHDKKSNSNTFLTSKMFILTNIVKLWPENTDSKKENKRQLASTHHHIQFFQPSTCAFTLKLIWDVIDYGVHKKPINKILSTSTREPPYRVQCSNSKKKRDNLIWITYLIYYIKKEDNSSILILSFGFMMFFPRTMVPWQINSRN